MQPLGIILFQSSLIGANATSNPLSWVGGRTVLTFDGTSYGTTFAPQVQGLNGSWIPVCSAIVSNQMFAFDAPPGLYRVSHSAGSSVNVAVAMNIAPR